MVLSLVTLESPVYMVSHLLCMAMVLVCVDLLKQYLVIGWVCERWLAQLPSSSQCRSWHKFEDLLPLLAFIIPVL